MRRFHPHLTVARSEPPVHLPATYADTFLATEPFAIGHVVLYRSWFHGGGTTYESLRSFSPPWVTGRSAQVLVFEHLFE